MRTSDSDFDLVTSADGVEPHEVWHVSCFSSFQEMDGVIQAVLTLMEERGYSQRDLFGTRLALEEAICNAIKHGHRSDPTKVGVVRCCVGVDQIVFEVEDQGPGFDPVRIPDATAYENLQRPSGRGLLLIRHFAAWMSHNRKGNGIAFCICPSEPLLARQAVQPLLAVAN